MLNKRIGRTGLVVIVVTVLLFSSCSNGGDDSVNYDDTLSIVEELNSESNFGEYQMLQPTKNPDDDFDPGNPDMFYEYNSAGEKALEGMYFGYPKADDDRLLTKLFIYTQDFSLYGFTIGASEGGAIDALVSRGFHEGDSKNDGLWYTQADVIIILQVKDESITRISINISSSAS